MLISNYVTEHPNREQQAQWQSCLSAIVTDCHKSQNVSREEMQQLGNKIMNYFGVYSFDATFSLFGKFNEDQPWQSLSKHRRCMSPFHF